MSSEEETVRDLQRQLQDCRTQLQQEMLTCTTLEQELQRSRSAFRNIEERTNLLLNAIPDKIFRHHSDGSFLDIKGQSADLILPRETLIESNLRDLPMPEDIKGKLLELIQLTIATGQTHTFEHQLTKQNEVYTYESRFVKSGVDEVVCLVRDITERHRAETTLHKAN
jgi:PAS domain S-box-containing protein